MAIGRASKCGPPPARLADDIVTPAAVSAVPTMRRPLARRNGCRAARASHVRPDILLTLMRRQETALACWRDVRAGVLDDSGDEERRNLRGPLGLGRQWTCSALDCHLMIPPILGARSRRAHIRHIHGRTVQQLGSGEALHTAPR